jgi:hypothetical protein
VQDDVQLTDEEIDRIMARDNGPYVLLEYCRNGWISAERAVTIIEERTRPPLWKRIIWAALETVFG